MKIQFFFLAKLCKLGICHYDWTESPQTDHCKSCVSLSRSSALFQYYKVHIPQELQIWPASWKTISRIALSNAWLTAGSNSDVLQFGSDLQRLGREPLVRPLRDNVSESSWAFRYVTSCSEYKRRKSAAAASTVCP